MENNENIQKYIDFIINKLNTHWVVGYERSKENDLDFSIKYVMPKIVREVEPRAKKDIKQAHDDIEKKYEEIYEDIYERDSERKAEPVEIDLQNDYHKYNNKLLILGEAGSGKSTLLCYLRYYFASMFKEIGLFPIYIYLPVFLKEYFKENNTKEKPENTILNYEQCISEYLFNSFFNEGARNFEFLKFKKCKRIFLLDAWDEIWNIESDDNCYERALDFVKKISSENNDIIVITSRMSGQEEKLFSLKIDRCAIECLNESQKITIINHTIKDEIKKRHLVADIKSPCIRDLTDNPLLLSLICNYYESGNRLPNRIQIYQHSIDYLLSEWLREKKTSSIRNVDKIDIVNLKKIIKQELRVLAFKNFESKHGETRALFESNQISVLLEKLRNESKNEKAKTLFNESGLFVEFGYECYKFLHLTFQEYFIAEYLKENVIDRLNIIDKISKNYFAYAHWQEAIGFLVELLKQDNKEEIQNIMNMILDPDREDLFHTNLLFAGYLLRYITGVLEQENDIIKKLYSTRKYLLTEIFKNHDPSGLLKSQIGHHSIFEDDVKKIEKLLSYLTTYYNIEYLKENREIFIGKVHPCLWKLADNELTDFLIEKLADRKMQNEAIKALKFVKHDLVVQKLIDQLYNDKFETRLVTVEALGHIGSNKSVPVLLSILHELVKSVPSSPNFEENSRLSDKIIYALSCIEDNKAIEPLLTIVVQQNISTQQKSIPMFFERTISYALSRIYEKNKSDDLVNKLIALLKHHNKQVQETALRTLAYIRDKRSVKPIIQFLKYLDNSEKKEAFTKFSYFSPMKELAIDTLGKLHDERVIPELKKLLDKKGAEVNFSLAYALATYGDTNAMETMFQRFDIIKCFDEIEFDKIIDIFTRIKGQDFVSQLLSFIHKFLPIIDERLNYYVKFRFIAVVKALEKIGTEKVIEFFIDLLKYSKFSKNNIVWALGIMGNSRAVKPLIEELTINTKFDQEYYLFVAYALKDIGDQKALEIHIKMFNQFSLSNQLTIASFIADLGDEETARMFFHVLLRIELKKNRLDFESRSNTEDIYLNKKIYDELFLEKMSEVFLQTSIWFLVETIYKLSKKFNLKIIAPGIILKYANQIKELFDQIENIKKKIEVQGLTEEIKKECNIICICEDVKNLHDKLENIAKAFGYEDIIPGMIDKCESLLKELGKIEENIKKPEITAAESEHGYLNANIEMTTEQISKLEKDFKQLNRDYRQTIKTISPKMLEIFKKLDPLINTDIRVLVLGETGTGKELIAKVIHENDKKRKNGPFISVNCAAIPNDLIESELFGHEKGAFTGATSRKLGMFELANGGTIFLDEIGDMSLNAQAKCLRVLQEKELVRVGGNQRIKIDVRVISATSKPITDMINDKLFREDLYYRLDGISIDLPSLRDRKEDISLLVEHFLKKISEKNSNKIKTFSKNALKKLIIHDWPGNVRELESVIEKTYFLSTADIIEENYIEYDIKKDSKLVKSKKNKTQNNDDANLEKLMNALKTIDLKEEDRMGKACKKIGIGRSTGHRLFNNYSLNQKNFHPRI